MSDSKASGAQENGKRLSTGLPALDRLLSGGLLPGRTTVVLGATGIGKSQLGIHFAAAGRQQEGEPGFFFDMTARGDSQNHQEYARRLFQWELREAPAEPLRDPRELWQRDKCRFDVIHPFTNTGKRVTRDDLDPDEYREWQVELTRRLDVTIHYFYGNLIHGARRCVIDGVEPVHRPSESFQFDLFEYIQQQILKKEAEWVARDLLRVRYREHEAEVRQHVYDPASVGCLVLCTTREMMLEDLISRPLDSGDILSNANTILLMGKIRDGLKMGRALYVAKHRGSACEESIVPYQIDANGLTLLTD